MFSTLLMDVAKALHEECAFRFALPVASRKTVALAEVLHDALTSSIEGIVSSSRPVEWVSTPRAVFVHAPVHIKAQPANVNAQRMVHMMSTCRGEDRRDENGDDERRLTNHQSS